jgi:two-component system, NtrC family, response regulator AtoC
MSSVKQAPLRILVVEDEPDLRLLLAEALAEAGHEAMLAADGAEGLRLVTAHSFDVVVSDVNLPKVDGRTLLRQTLASTPSTRVILITAYGEIAHAVAALKEGAYDYLAKPFEIEHLLSRLGRIAEQRTTERELQQARATLAGLAPQTLLIGDSPPMRKVMSLVDMVAGSNAPALIVGESGTGKEIVARLIHDRGARRQQPYVAVNCGALTETLMEAELFGHERGAFTGADRKREGRFKAADGGTIFLDEVAELPLAAQAKLLRVLQEGTFEPLGSNTSTKVDVRVISATHRNLRERVKQNLFREDLYYRINVIELPLPPLRDRPGDLALLAHHFLQRFAGKGPLPAVSAGAWEALARHRFPGNVRELSHAVQHAVVLSGGGEIQLHHLPPTIQLAPAVTEPARPGAAPAASSVDGAGADNAVAGGASPAHPARPIRSLVEAVREYEKECVRQVLADNKGDRASTARALGLSARVLTDKLRIYGLQG